MTHGAQCADRCLADDQAALFTSDGTVTVYAGDPAPTEPLQRLRAHAELTEAFQVLDPSEVTTHFNRQSTITLDGDQASGETYCRTTCGTRTANACCSSSPFAT